MRIATKRSKTMYIASDQDLQSIYTIRDTANGKGVFALKDIPEQTILMRVKGEPVDFRKTKKLGDFESYSLQVGINQYILTEPPFCYLNHSCEPNAALDSDLFLYTIKQVRAGEEIRWDYSTSMMERSWTMECHCGSPACRGMIRDFDLLPEWLQDKYFSLGIVMPFIVRKLRKAV